MQIDSREYMNEEIATFVFRGMWKYENTLVDNFNTRRLIVMLVKENMATVIEMPKQSMFPNARDRLREHQRS